jgi:LysM repeat protein
MSDNSIFGEQSEPQTPAGSEDDKPAADQLLGAITNSEGKQKYSTVEDALKGLQAAQEHISRLESENTDYSNKAATAKTMEDVLAAMKPQGVAEPEGSPAQLDEATLANVVDTLLNKRETATTQTQNTKAVAAKFTDKYGKDAEMTYYKLSSEIGFSKEEINRLAASNPTAVFKMLGVDVSTPDKNNLNSTFGTQNFQEKKDKLPRFDPMKPAVNSALEKFRASKAETNERLGV